MRVNRITETPVQRNISASKQHTPEFTANPKITKTLANCGIIAITAAVCAWLAKLFYDSPKDDSIFLYDGSYVGEAYELDKLV